MTATAARTPQQEQTQQWFDDVAALLQKLGGSFSELKKGTQRDLVAATDDIAKLRNDFASAETRYRERFTALAEYYQRGGAYKGPFREMAQAADFCRAVIAVPEILVNEILRNVETYGAFERNVPATPVTSQSGSMVKRTGGLTVYHPDIAQAPDESGPTLGRVMFNLTRYATLTYVDQWMLDMALAAALDDFVAQEIALALAYAGDLYGFMGDGSATHARVTGAFKQSGTGQLTVTAESGDDTFAEVIAKHVTYLALALGALPQWGHVSGAKFYMHLSIFAGYLGQRLTTGAPVADILSADRPSPFVLMGYPVEITQVAPTLSAQTQADTTMLIFGALQRGWRLFRLQPPGIRIRVSNDYKFAEGLQAIAGDALQDIQECDKSAYVQLKTHS